MMLGNNILKVLNLKELNTSVSIPQFGYEHDIILKICLRRKLLYESYDSKVVGEDDSSHRTKKYL